MNTLKMPWYHASTPSSPTFPPNYKKYLSAIGPKPLRHIPGNEAVNEAVKTATMFPEIHTDTFPSSLDLTFD